MLGGTMRLLFLDFDGVLHPLDEAPEAKRFCWLPLLENLLEEHPDVHIVIHSTWRYIYADDELRAFLGPLGEQFAGSTPRAPREQSIEMVLQANRLVRYHLALDDAPKEFTGSAVNLLPLDSRRGISDESAQTAIATWLLSTAPVQPRTTR